MKKRISELLNHGTSVPLQVGPCIVQQNAKKDALACSLFCFSILVCSLGGLIILSCWATLAFYGVQGYLWPPPTRYPWGSAGKESACNAGDLGLILGLGRSPGEGRSYPLQYSSLEKSMDCIVYGVTKSWTALSDFHFHWPPPTRCWSQPPIQL